MQKNYFLKTVFTVLLCSFFSLSYAVQADYYISSAGNDDTGDGLTAETAWASFSKANTAAASGDIIHVSGMIDFTLDPANTTTNTGTSTGSLAGIILNKSITLQGTSSATDGFTGTNGSVTTRFFQITNALYTLTLKNLKLANGVAQSTSTADGGGAILMTTGNMVAENVIFDGNIATGKSDIVGAAISIRGSNTTGTSFKNCVFSNNEATKAGAININSWAANSTILFEGCSFIGNIAKESFGGSALYIRANTSANATLNIINSTFKGNHVNTSTNGGTIYVVKSPNTTKVNIINCTVTGNTTAAGATASAGVFFLTSDAAADASVYIKNCIIEGNTTTTGLPADLNLNAASATETGASTGYLSIENSIVGSIGTPANLPEGNIVDSPHFNYLTSTSTTNDLKAGLAPFNATNNTYPLYVGSNAIGYGNSTFLTGLSPAVTTDQLGNVRTVGATNYAGAWESTPVATTTPGAPTDLVATAGDTQLSLAFKSAATGGSIVTNYKYSVNDGAYVALDPIANTSPIVITGLTNNTEYTVKLIAVNANGDSPASVASNAVTPTGTTNLKNALKNAIAVSKNANNQIVVNNSTQNAGIVTIYNTVGQQVDNVTLTAATVTSAKSFKAGIYLVMVTIEGVTHSTKIAI